MQYHVYHVEGENARKYLKNTNFVGVWGEDVYDTLEKVSQSFKPGTKITEVIDTDLVPEAIGYLY